MRATSTFEIKSWDEKTWDGRDWREVKGADLTHADIRYVYHGDLEAESRIQMLVTYSDAGTSQFVSLEHIEGTLGGKQGTFVLQSEGGYDGEVAKSDWFVVPGSGTGELTGLQARGSSAVGHDPESLRLDFDYDFE
jgi:hypothetical protein